MSVYMSVKRMSREEHIQPLAAPRRSIQLHTAHGVGLSGTFLRLHTVSGHPHQDSGFTHCFLLFHSFSA